MAYSIQTAVSDGTLAVLDLSIRYMDKSHVQVYVDDVLADGAAYSYVWLTDTRIQIVPAVANGSTLKVIRKTLTDEMWHEFTQGARFSTTSMDENFEQLLFLAQEYSEGIYVSDFYTDVDIHLHKVLNLADPVSDGDAVNFKTLKDFLPYGEAAIGLVTRVTAEETKSNQLIAQGIPYANKLIVGFNATGIPDGAWVNFAGRDTVGDGGGGVFRYSTSSTQTADNIYVFAPTGGGRLIRDGWTTFGFNGTTEAAWSGADTAVDPTTNIQNLFNAAAGRPIQLTPNKIYALSAQVTIPSTSIDITGNSMDLCGFSYTGNFDLFVGTGSVGNLLPTPKLTNVCVKKTGGTSGQLMKLTLADVPLFTSVRFHGANGADPAYLMLLGCKFGGLASCKFTGGASALWGSSDMTSTGVWGEGNTAFNCVADTPRQGLNVTYQKNFTGLMCKTYGATSTYGCGWVIEYENNGVNLAFCSSYSNVRNGYYVEGSVAFGCQNIAFTGCIGYGNGEAGINLDANFRNVYINGGAYYSNTDTFSAGTGHGIMGAGSRYVSIGGGVSIYGNAGSGIWYNGAFDLKIGEVDIRDNAKYAVDLQGSKALVRISSQASFNSNTLGTVNNWSYLGNNEWQGGPWESYTPTFYKSNESTTVTFSTLNAKWKRENGQITCNIVAVTPSVALDGYTFVSLPVVGTWPDNSSASQALLPRGFACMDVSGTQAIDGAFANDKVRIVKTASGDTTIRATINCEV